MRYLLILPLFCSILLPNAYANEAKNLTYSMEDLKVLAQNSEWYEYLQHVKDIRPSERNKDWQELTLKVATSLIKDIKNFGPYTKKELDLLTQLKSFEFLANDEFFNHYLSDFKLQYLKNCLKLNENTFNCLNSADQYWDTNHQTAQIGLEFFMLFHQYFTNFPAQISNNQILLKTYWKFLVPSVQEANSNTCQQDHVKNTIKSIYFTTLSQKNWELKSSTLTNLISSSCWSHLKHAFEHDLSHSPISLAELAFNALDTAKQLDKKFKNLFYFRTFLENTSKGDQLNLAWASIEELSESKSDRDELLALVVQLDPLPDQVLGLDDKNKKIILFSHLGRNFPEFIDHYSSLCLKYLNGSAKFPRGNPTIHCQQLFENSAFKSLLIPGLQEKYQAVKI